MVRGEQAGAPACRMCGAATACCAVIDGFEMVECVECCFVFAAAITARTMENSYHAGRHGADAGAPQLGWASLGFLAPAARHLPPRPLKILDFGTGDSVVPDRLRTWGHQVVGVDVAPPQRPHPDRLTGSLLDLDLDAGQFDLAFSYQVFEHLPEPRPLVERMLELTRPGGLVLIHTDMETPERDQGLDRWWYACPPDHCSLYRHRTFERFLADRADRLLYCDAKIVLIESAAGPRS